MLRKISLLIAGLLAVALLAGCAPGTDQPVAARADSEPSSNLPGYYAAEQTLRGGQELYGQNLSDIQMTSDAGDTVITLNFMSGSLQLGMEEVASAGVPSYTTSHIAGLNRLVLSIEGLIFWDYKVFKDEMNELPIGGVLQEVPINTEQTRLYISVKDEYAYKIVERGNKLEIRIRTLNKADDIKWYATLNAFNEYSDGLLDDDLGLLPILSSDKVNAMLVSQPFDTQEEAQAFAQQVQQKLATLSLPQDDEVARQLMAKPVSVVKLANSQLPDYNEQGMLQALAESPVLKKDGQEQRAPALVSNGRVLCYTPDASSYVFTRPFFLSAEDGGVTIYEKLYQCSTQDDVPQLLLEFEFSSILQASFSPDGRYLAFIDQTSMVRSLYLYDIQTQSLIAAAEEGLGDDTAACAWALSGSTLYAVTGELDVLQLMQMDILADGTYSVKTLSDAQMSSGDMDVSGGTIYLSQSGGEWEDGIYAVDAATGQGRRLCGGFSFLLSRKSGNLLVLEDAQQDGYTLKTVTPGGGETAVAQNLAIGEVAWDADGAALYYTVFDDAGDDAGYPVTLYRFSGGESAAVAKLVNGQLVPAGAAGQTLLVYVYSQNEQFIPVTYTISGQ
ncbi:MAG: hypothetical protein PHO66_01600 [Eubacteriales bacterium]|nr:hypothetical protein [Eubacteriales bacterium]